jgi:hypothetical protein
MKESHFSNREMLRLKAGTKVKIKDRVKCADKFKVGGELVFQTVSQTDDGDRQFGIRIPGFGICFSFKCDDYEIIK